MDFNNIDLKSDYEKNQSIIDALFFDTLLLEISCNIREINKETVMAQFETDLKNRIISAREIMLSNLDNIVKEAQEYRNND